MSEIFFQKKILRQHLHLRLQQIPSDLRLLWSGQICQKIAGRKDFRKARCVALFASLPTEVETCSLIQEAFTLGKRVVFPKIQESTKPTLVFFEVHPEEEWKEHPWGMREPDLGPSRLPVEISEIDFMLIPGLAFDRNGQRLGRGKGFYDSVLKDFLGVRVGVCFECQVLETLPTNSWDERVDAVVTEKDLEPAGKKT